MKNHPERILSRFVGMSDSLPADRIAEDRLHLLMNGWCDRHGRIHKYASTYPVTMADSFAIVEGDPRITVWSADHVRGKDSIERAVCIIGDGMYRSGPNNIYDNWAAITFASTYRTPDLDRPAAFAHRGRYCYHQNGHDMPFRVPMWQDDGEEPDTLAEPLGLRTPLHTMKYSSNSAGTRFWHNTVTNYVVTFVYGDRGESGPSPLAYLRLTSSENFDSVVFDHLPIGPTGVTARRIYRTKIGYGRKGQTGAGDRQLAYDPISVEMFFLGEIADNTETTFTDDKDDNKLDFLRRVPPQRPFVPVAKYQVLHQDHFAWSNIKDHPWTLGIHTDVADTAVVAGSITIDNTGNGTITFNYTNGGGAQQTIVSNYKTKTLLEIWQTLVPAPDNSITTPSVGYSDGGDGCVVRVAPGVDWGRTYVFREVTNRNILGGANVYWFEAFDDPENEVAVDGQEQRPNRTMWSNVLFPEEINPLNVVDHSRHDNFPVTGLAHNDHELIVMQESGIETISGSFFTDPVTFRPQFHRARTQAEHGSVCTRPDAIAMTPEGVIFVAWDGLRLFRGGRTVPIGDDIDRRLMSRLLREPRTRDNLTMIYWTVKATLYVAYPGGEVAVAAADIDAALAV